jgi:hypothetical protein
VGEWIVLFAPTSTTGNCTCMCTVNESLSPSSCIVPSFLLHCVPIQYAYFNKTCGLLDRSRSTTRTDQVRSLMHVLHCWSHRHIDNMTLAALRYPAAVRPAVSARHGNASHHIVSCHRTDCLQVADAQALENVDVNGRQQSAQLLL